MNYNDLYYLNNKNKYLELLFHLILDFLKHKNQIFIKIKLLQKIH